MSDDEKRIIEEAVADELREAFSVLVNGLVLGDKAKSLERFVRAVRLIRQAKVMALHVDLTEG